KLLADVLARATPLEAKYLVKLLTGDLRIGLREGLVEDAIARAFAQPLAEVAMANMLTSDIGEAAARARAGKLKDVTMRLSEPLRVLPTGAIIDGEIITARGEQILPFSDLQKRLGRKTVGADLLESAPVVFVAYDLLYAGQRVLIDDPLETRLAKLAELVRTACGSGRWSLGALRLSVAKRFRVVTSLHAQFDASCERSSDGLM